MPFYDQRLGFDAGGVDISGYPTAQSQALTQPPLAQPTGSPYSNALLTTMPPPPAPLPFGLGGGGAPNPNANAGLIGWNGPAPTTPAAQATPAALPPVSAAPPTAPGVPPNLDALLRSLVPQQPAAAPPTQAASPYQMQSVTAPQLGSPTQVQAPQLGAPSQVQAPPTPEAYRAAVQAALAPVFDDSFKQLAAREAAMGILDSGGARRDFSDLNARNNATVAQLLSPLIQQGFGQQFSANVANAGAANDFARLNADRQFQGGIFNASNANDFAKLNTDRQFQSGVYNAQSANDWTRLLQNQGFQAGENNANRDLRGQEFNANLLRDIAFRNANAQDQYNLARLGYGHDNYRQMIGSLAGLESQGLGGLGYVLGQGMQNQFNGYRNGYGDVLPFAQSIGAAAGLPSQTQPPFRFGVANGGPPGLGGLYGLGSDQAALNPAQYQSKPDPYAGTNGAGQSGGYAL